MATRERPVLKVESFGSMITTGGSTETPEVPVLAIDDRRRYQHTLIYRFVGPAGKRAEVTRT